jgi:hypothetical protein
VVGVVELRDESGDHSVAAALDNALRTLLALAAVDPKRRGMGLHVESKRVGNVQVTTLGGPASPFAYAVGPDYLAVGTSSEAVARFGTDSPNSMMTQFKSAYFPKANAYAVVDVVRLVATARAHRTALAEKFSASRNLPVADVTRDLDRAIELLEMFQGSFYAIAVDPGMSYVHQSLGVIARAEEPADR